MQTSPLSDSIGTQTVSKPPSGVDEVVPSSSSLNESLHAAPSLTETVIPELQTIFPLSSNQTRPSDQSDLTLKKVPTVPDTRSSRTIPENPHRPHILTNRNEDSDMELESVSSSPPYSPQLLVADLPSGDIGGQAQSQNTSETLIDMTHLAQNNGAHEPLPFSEHVLLISSRNVLTVYRGEGRTTGT